MGTELGSEQLRRIKATGARTALFYPDFHFEHRGVALASFAEFDHIFTTKTFHVDFLGQRFGAHRVHYVPHGYSSSVHFPLYGELSDGEYEVDYQHVGLASAHKAGQLAALKAAQPNSSMRLVGAYWEKFCTGTPLAASLGGPSQTGTAYSRLLQTARINVAVLMGSDKTGWADKVSTRSFEIPASRGFMLHEDNDEIREFFEPGAEIDVFSSIHELIEKSGFYLARPDLRARMIERAHARCVPAYSYDARAEQIHKTLRDGK